LNNSIGCRRWPSDLQVRTTELLRVFAGLKTRLLINATTRSVRARLGLLVLAVALGGSMLSFVVVVSRAAARADGGPRLSVAFTTMWIAWVGLPFLLGGIDDAVDPDRLAELPLRRVELAAGTIVAASIGVLPAATLVGLLGMVVTLTLRRPPSLAFVTLVALAQFALCVVGSRLIATLLVRASRSRRARDFGVVLAAALTSGLWMAIQSLPVASTEVRARITGVLAWTPPGALGRAAHDASFGRYSMSGVRVAFVLAVVLAMAWWWTIELAKSMGTRRSGAMAREPRRSFAEPVAASEEVPTRRRARGPINHPASVVVRKELRYLFRSPYRRASLVVGCLFGAPFVLLQSMRLNPETLPPVAAAPIALLFGIAISHNLLGLDASSLWIELGTGIRLRHLLLGRALAAAPTLVTPVWVAALLTVAVRRDATALLPTLALSVAAAGVPLGVGALISVLVPFPVPDDSSPFGNHSAMTGRGCLVGLVHAFGLCVSAVLLSPVFAFAVMRRGVDVTTVVGCAAWSLIVLLSGVWLGDRYSERRPGALAEAILNGLR
jgi:ABC-2 type transport system permease protein